jgi:hypothetical protein
MSRPRAATSVARRIAGAPVVEAVEENAERDLVLAAGGKCPWME